MIVREDNKTYYSQTYHKNVGLVYRPPKGIHNLIIHSSSSEEELRCGFLDSPELISTLNFIHVLDENGNVEDQIPVEVMLDEVRFEGFSSICFKNSGHLTPPNFFIRKFVFPSELTTAALPGHSYNGHKSMVDCMDFSNCTKLSCCQTGFLESWANVKDVIFPNYLYPSLILKEGSINYLPKLERLILPPNICIYNDSLSFLGNESENGVDIPLYNVECTVTEQACTDLNAAIRDSTINRLVLSGNITFEHDENSYFCRNCKIKELILAPSNNNYSHMFNDCEIGSIRYVVGKGNIDFSSLVPDFNKFLSAFAKDAGIPVPTNSRIDTENTIADIYESIRHWVD